MTEEEIENYFVESAGYGRDKVRNFMDIVNKALKQKGERIAELEKENTELKTEKGCKTCTKFDEVNLTKAKEIIKSLLDCLRQDTNDPQTNYYVGLYMTEAEQFLKDSEVEK